MNILPRHLDDEELVESNDYQESSSYPFFLFLLTLASVMGTVGWMVTLVLDSGIFPKHDMFQAVIASIPAIAGSASSGFATWAATQSMLKSKKAYKSLLSTLSVFFLLIAFVLWTMAFWLIIN